MLQKQWAGRHHSAALSKAVRDLGLALDQAASRPRLFLDGGGSLNQDLDLTDYWSCSNLEQPLLTASRTQRYAVIQAKKFDSLP